MSQSKEGAGGSIDLHDVVLVPIKSLKKDPTNPNVMNERQMNGLRASMKRFGYLQPVIVDKNTMVIADGEHRATIYEESGRTEVPCILLDLKDDAERRLLRQTMNKLRGQHRLDKDLSEIDFLIKSSKLSELSLLTGTDSSRLLTLLKRGTPQSSDGMISDEPTNRVSEGQLWKLGNHRLLCGNSFVKKDVERLIGGNEIELMISDPPYGINIVMEDQSDQGVTVRRVDLPGAAPARIYHNAMTGDNAPFNPKPILKYGKKQIIWGANHFANLLPIGNSWIVWDKKAGTGPDHNSFTDVELAWTNLDRKSSLIYRFLWSGLIREGPRFTELQQRMHPTQKPVGLYTAIINDHTKEGDFVLDLFAGSGSSLISCEQINRKCLALDIDPYYCNVILDRFERFTGRKPELVN